MGIASGSSRARLVGGGAGGGQARVLVGGPVELEAGDCLNYLRAQEGDIGNHVAGMQPLVWVKSSAISQA